MDDLGAAPADRGRIRFNPYDPVFRTDPYRTYGLLRSRAPVYRTMGTVVLTRYEEVAETLKNRSFSAALIPEAITRHAQKLGICEIEQVERFISKSIVFTDNPEHARLRRLVGRAFTPESIAPLQRLVADEVEALLSVLDGCDAFDVIAAIAKPLPVNVLCAWIGVPRPQRGFVAARAHILRLLLDPGFMTPDEFGAVIVALRELVAYFADLAGSRTGGATLIDQLAEARENGAGLSAEELAFACVMAFVAGNETTQCLIGNAVFLLLSHPGELQRLRQDAGLLGGAIEEVLRFETPLQLTKRRATQDTLINGNLIRANEHVLLALAAANRDPDRFADADRFDIGRGSREHVAFGYGMHNCIGGLLARRQAETALSSLLRRFPRLALCQEEVQWQTQSFILRGPSRLDVWTARQ